MLESYNINIFGFPNSPALDAQNLGIRDQRAALEWLRDNTAGFGGDPTRIVLGGQSSGADTGESMLHSHATDPTVHGMVFQACSAQVIDAAETNVDTDFVHVPTAVGCRLPKWRPKKEAGLYERYYRRRTTQSCLKPRLQYIRESTGWGIYGGQCHIVYLARVGHAPAHGQLCHGCKITALAKFAPPRIFH